ncbi:tyrosine-type recombinase/integrase [Sphingomonas hankyongi]|uniref:Tyrosine-type recombinase/integrase n=1 Tax=Sphingomonas hankyongi TaxID=2908209 RepID=A0ABT0S2D9_9SPHN|nr:tyrosine-type recombinase/integrase [Sphingomonas hankyongi]MCL6729786.1 tyrosine-type recombinase/integrase [Sphingomonas hankyongi]
MFYTLAFNSTGRKPTGAKLALKPFHVWGIRVRLQVANRVRDLALFDLALDSKLRGCDLVRLRVSDLVSASGVKRRVMILQRKTGRPVQFEVTEQARRSIGAWAERKQLGSDDWLFPSRLKPGHHLSTRQYARLVDEWVVMVGLDPAAYGTHSLRRTKVALLYKKTGNLRACQLLLGHTKLESTVRYLGVEVDDALELSEALEL